MTEKVSHVYMTKHETLRPLLDRGLKELSLNGQIEYTSMTSLWREEKALERSSAMQVDNRYEVLIEEIVGENGQAVLALLDINHNPRPIEIIGIINLDRKREESERLLGMFIANYSVTREGPVPKVG